MRSYQAEPGSFVDPVVFAEDIQPGQTYDLGTYHLQRPDIIGFATQWDPFPMHTDVVAAERSAFQGLVASGMQSLAILQRLSVLGVYGGWALIAGIRLERVRFLAPVREDALLTGHIRVQSVDLQPQRTRGLIENRSSLICDEELLLEVTIHMLVRMAPGGSPEVVEDFSGGLPG